MRAATLARCVILAVVLGIVAASAQAGKLEDAVIESQRELISKAEEGDVEAQMSLGGRYHSGLLVPQDYVAAAKWYRRAAERGDATAQYSFGLMCFRGEGVPENSVLGHMWLDLATAQDFRGAREVRDMYVSMNKMTPAQIAEAQRLAREWKPKK